MTVDGRAVLLMCIAAVALGAMALAIRPQKARPGAGAVAQSTLHDLPRHAISLGRPDAPVTLTVYADLTSAGFQRFDLDVLPAVIRRYVRPGRLRIQLRTLAPPTAGPTALHAARLAQAAGLQGRLWEFVETFEGRYSGELDDVTQHQLLRAVPGLDARASVAAAQSPRVIRAVQRANRLAPRLDSPDPIFILGGEQSIEISARLTPKPFVDAIAGRWQLAMGSAPV